MEDDFEQVYGNIRFKTPKEKLSNGDEASSGPSKTTSTITRFLTDECLPSHFDSDLIPYDDLKRAYKNYCQVQGISNS